MGQLVTAPYDAAEGREYVTYIRNTVRAADRLRAEGRLPDNEGTATFFDDALRVVQVIERDSARGSGQVVSRIDMTASEHRRLLDMNESVRTLLEILEMRQAVELHRTPACARVAAAVIGGSFEP